MTTRSDHDGMRAAVDLVIFDVLERDPDRVLRAIAEVAERLHTEGRHPASEIEEAVVQLCTELGISPRVKSNRARSCH